MESIGVPSLEQIFGTHVVERGRTVDDVTHDLRPNQEDFSIVLQLQSLLTLAHPLALHSDFLLEQICPDFRVDCVRLLEISNTEQQTEL